MKKEYHELTDEDLARIVHEAHLALRIGLNDSATDVHFDALPPDRKEMEIHQVQMFQEGATPAQVHQMWVDWMRLRGWKHGSQRDFVRQTHPSMTEYQLLSLDAKVKVRQAQEIVLFHDQILAYNNPAR